MSGNQPWCASGQPFKDSRPIELRHPRRVPGDIRSALATATPIYSERLPSRRLRPRKPPGSRPPFVAPQSSRRCGGYTCSARNAGLVAEAHPPPNLREPGRLRSARRAVLVAMTCSLTRRTAPGYPYANGAVRGRGRCRLLPRPPRPAAWRADIRSRGRRCRPLLLPDREAEAGASEKCVL